MTSQEIINTGQTIANETHIGGNTAERVGGVIEGIGKNLTELAGKLAESTYCFGSETNSTYRSDNRVVTAYPIVSGINKYYLTISTATISSSNYLQVRLVDSTNLGYFTQNAHLVRKIADVTSHNISYEIELSDAEMASVKTIMIGTFKADSNQTPCEFTTALYNNMDNSLSKEFRDVKENFPIKISNLDETVISFLGKYAITDGVIDTYQSDNRVKTIIPLDTTFRKYKLVLKNVSVGNNYLIIKLMSTTNIGFWGSAYTVRDIQNYVVSDGTYTFELSDAETSSVKGLGIGMANADASQTPTSFEALLLINEEGSIRNKVTELDEEIGRITQKENELESNINNVNLSIDSINNDIYTIESSLSIFTSLRNRYIKASDGSIVSAANYFYTYRIYDVDAKEVRAIYVNVGATDSVPAAIAFYSSNIDLDGLTPPTEVEGFISSIPMAVGVTEYYSVIPDGCKMIVVTNRNTVVSTPSISLYYSLTNKNKDEIDKIKKSIIPLNYKNFLFDNTPCYAHLFINDHQWGGVPKVPSQSLFDVDIAARLGFKYIETNVQKTLDNVLIPIHGTSGKFGTQVVDLNNETTYSDTLISSVTYDWIKSNVRYNTSIPAYRTTIPTLEEFLSCAKSHGISVMITLTESSYPLIKKYYGDDFIAYAVNREYGFTGIVMNYSGLSTKEAIFAKCEQVGAPYIHMPDTTVINSLLEDETELKEIIQGVHERGCLFGIIECYISEQKTLKLLELGADVIASAYFANDFDYGNIFNLKGDVNDYDDFVTNGSIDNVDGTLDLADGQYITTAESQNEKLCKMSLRVRFVGELSLGSFGEISAHEEVTLVSEVDKSKEIWIGTFGYNKKPTFSLTSNGDSKIISINFKSSKC